MQKFGTFPFKFFASKKTSLSCNLRLLLTPPFPLYRQATWRDCERDLNSFKREAEELGEWLANKEKALLIWKQVEKLTTSM
jgi:hypothetical protein